MTDNKNNKSHKRSLSEKDYKYFFWYVLISTIVIVFFFAIITLKDYKFNFSTDFQFSISVIFTVLGVYIAFSAINTYSIFNSRVKDEKEELENLKSKSKDEIEELINEYKSVVGTFNINQEKFEDLTKKIELENTLNNIITNIQMVKRVTAVYKLIGIIDGKMKKKNETNLINERGILNEELIELKEIINLKMRNIKSDKIKNEGFKRAIEKLRILLEDIK